MRSVFIERGGRLFEVEARLVDGGDDPGPFLEIGSIVEVLYGGYSLPLGDDEVELTQDEVQNVFDVLCCEEVSNGGS
jgi:hypothetical protein